MTHQPTLEDWISALRAAASLTGDLSATAHRVGPIGFLRLMGADDPNSNPHKGIDESLWLATTDPTIHPDEITGWLDPDGPLRKQPESQAIELWTERELGALHALWRLAQIREYAPWRQRALDAARWHLTNTQPDNATNHPWAIPVFLDLWSADPESDESLSARLYAETLLHNCQTMNAKPDPLSALILLDAANGLELLKESG